MKKLAVVLLVTAVAACGFGLGDVTGGGGSLDTAKADALIKELTTIEGDFTAIKTTLENADAYLTEVATAHGIADILSDPTAAAKLAGELSADEKTKLGEHFSALGKVPADLTALTGKIPEVSTKAPEVITDLASQLKKSPLKAGEVGKLTDQLNAGVKACETVTGEAGETTEKATTLTETLTKML